MRKHKELFFLVFLVSLSLVLLINQPSIYLMFAIGGVITNGIMGGVRGKVGGVVGSAWKGINYLRAWVIPKNPNSAGQQIVRTKMKEIVQQVLYLMPSVIPFAWDPFAVKMSGFNHFVNANYHLVDANNKFTINNLMSKGSLEPTSLLTATYASLTGIFTFTWNSSIFGNGEATDAAYGVIYDMQAKIFRKAGDLHAARSVGVGTLTTATNLTATNLIGFVLFSRGTGQDFIVSNSVADVAST